MPGYIVDSEQTLKPLYLLVTLHSTLFLHFISGNAQINATQNYRIFRLGLSFGVFCHTVVEDVVAYGDVTKCIAELLTKGRKESIYI